MLNHLQKSTTSNIINIIIHGYIARWWNDQHIRLSSVDLLGLIPARATIIKIIQNLDDFYLLNLFTYYSIISITEPAPTVCPPSRTENFEPFSIAIGAINSTVISVLSPGITISTPCFNVIEPVTSVVLK